MSNSPTPLFAKSQDAYSTAVADQIAPAGFNAFTACVPRSTKPYRDTAPRKRGPKPSKEAIVIASLRTDEERAHIRILAAARRVNPETHWAAPSGESLHRKEIRIELARAA